MYVWQITNKEDVSKPSHYEGLCIPKKPWMVLNCSRQHQTPHPPAAPPPKIALEYNIIPVWRRKRKSMWLPTLGIAGWRRPYADYMQGLRDLTENVFSTNVALVFDCIWRKGGRFRPTYRGWLRVRSYIHTHIHIQRRAKRVKCWVALVVFLAGNLSCLKRERRLWRGHSPRCRCLCRGLARGPTCQRHRWLRIRKTTPFPAFRHSFIGSVEDHETRLLLSKERV